MGIMPAASKTLGSIRSGLAPVYVFFAAMLAVGLGYVAEREIRHYKIVSAFPELVGRDSQVPNFHHIWFSHDPFMCDSLGGSISAGLSSFGLAYIKKKGNWTELCPMDLDRDGLTNGQEMGDPCCNWVPGMSQFFSLGSRHEYRRWHLTHPSRPPTADDPPVPDLPLSCDNYDPALYRSQFEHFYFDRYDGVDPEAYIPAKIVALMILVGLFVKWVRQGIVGDVFPFLFARSALSNKASLLTCIASFYYQDLTSGIIHLVLDYAPRASPIIGPLARGFQYHHADPTAIIRISWYEYVSHIHMLCPLIIAAILISDASRLQRLFWFWGMVFAHLFQTAHRWAHMPVETLSWPIRMAMGSGLLLTHEKHMMHHQDLESQFTILSGHTDFIVDNLARLVPPARYELWLCFTVFWFLLPIGLDIRYRALAEYIGDPHRKIKVGLDV